MATVAVILAEGNGERLKSALPEVLHPILGDPLLLWVLRALPGAIEQAVVLNGDRRIDSALDAWRAAGLLRCPVVSLPSRGEGLAGELDRLGSERMLVLSGDVPLVQPSTLERLLAAGPGWMLPVNAVSGPIDPLAPSAWCLDRAGLGKVASAEDLVAAIRRLACCSLEADPLERTPMASRRDQAFLTGVARNRINAAWMDDGVGFRDPASAYIGPRVHLGRDTYIDQDVLLEGEVRAGDGVTIAQGCVVRDSTLGPGTQVRPHCVIESAVVGQQVMIGPFARLREGTVLESGVHVGNYVETKKARLKSGAKANHLTYLGDCEVGEKTNVGAGCITCNYDGFGKHRTVIGRDVFVGSDCQLVAPVTIGDGAIIGAGTTLTQDVPPGSLTLARAALVHKEGGAERLRAKLRSKHRPGHS